MLSTAADMPGLLHITLVALLTGCDAFRLTSGQRVIPLSPPVARLFQDEGPAQPHFLQELVRTKRHSVQELVRAQPHLVHDMGWPEIHETSRSQNKMDTVNSSHSNPLSTASRDGTRTRDAVDENLNVEDEMEAAESHRGHPDTPDPQSELLSGPGAGDASREASGFYGTDMEDRDRGEEGAEDREKRGGEDEWERDTGEDRERTGEDEETRGGTDSQGVHVPNDLELNRTSPDLDSLIGYSPSLLPSSSKQPSISTQAEVHDPGLQEHRVSPVLEVAPLEKELWEAEGEEDTQSSGYGVLRSSISTTSTTSTSTSTSTAAPAAAAGGGTEGTVTPETDTGTDFGLLRRYSKDETEDEETAREEEEEETGLTHIGLFTQNPTVPEVGMAPSREPLQPSVEEELEPVLRGVQPKDQSEDVEEEKWREVEREETRIRHIIPLTTDPSPTIGFTDPSWDWMEKTTSLQTQRSEVKGGGVTEVFIPDGDFDEMEEADQVVCVDWSELTGRGYVILNMTQNLNCEEFRVDQGVRLLRIMEQVFARRMNSPEGSWVLYLSKPTHQQHQLLMNVASEHGVIATKDVLGMLGEIRKNLNQVGIQNYSAASSCQSRPSQTRSDYGKLFVVLVIIGSICMVIITSGFIYICWQRRLPATKTTFRAEELHFVENGCHDNPTLDVTNDSQPDMKEKKPSTNGLAGGGEGGGEESSRWQVFVNQAVTEEEEEEQDTHL
ncbi:podocalyxin-like protein 2 isoform X2 [Mastacembelus armatus]|uniref:podocalyxin-like protein 2 isoform X2 n=1 Tax=Mastacembelus armatus TaxID=205130 RepID=UPI000E4625A9|nr:podocalyxin-like protein 2 isoform X2 [Mastacembelus armatus]